MEPTHFRNGEKADNYVKDTTRQFLWLLEQYKTETNPEKRNKKYMKLRKWLDNHPSFVSAYNKIMSGGSE